jgi:hypothetical protein
VASDDRLAFVLHLCRASKLVAVAGGRLALDPDPVRVWLQADPARRRLDLQATWRDDPDWNDLWRVPSLKPQPTGWKNDPILARRRVLGFLAGCRPGVWYRLDDFIAMVKSVDPDFQRPDGDYTTWYLHDLRGQPLTGFEHWDEVEGALIHYLVSGPLHWLGVIDLGFEGDFGLTLAFRLAETGRSLLGQASSVTAERPQRDEPSPPSALAVRDDFTVHLPLAASLYDRFQLSRFADLVERRADQVSYRVSPASLARARRQGVTAEQVIAFLVRASDRRVPPKVLDGLRRWRDRSGAVRLERGVILRVKRPEILTTLRGDPIVAPLLGETLGPQAVLVPQANAQRVRHWLVEQGYLDEERRQEIG